MYTTLTLTFTILTLLYFTILIPGTAVSSDSKLLQHPQQDQSYIATLAGITQVQEVLLNLLPIHSTIVIMNCIMN